MSYGGKAASKKPDAGGAGGVIARSGAANAELLQTSGLIPVVALPDGYGLLPITLSVAQVAIWTGLGKTKVQELCNAGLIDTAKVDGRTLVLTNSVVAMIERNRVVRDR